MKRTILMLDADREGCISLAEELRKSPRVRKVLLAESVREAEDLAAEADVILLDPILPEQDGMSFLRRLMERGLRPGVFLLSSFFSADLLRECETMGVAQCMRKPVDFECLLRRVESWEGTDSVRLGGGDERLYQQASELLHRLGMTATSGYYDCCSGLVWLCRHPQSRGRITKELYPHLARLSGQTTGQVERNIRYAVERTWLTGDMELLTRFFGATVSAECGRPTNTVFLRTLADYLRSEEGALGPEQPFRRRDTG